MFYKRQRSNDFTIGRVCLLANEAVSFNDHYNQENILWAYSINGSVNIQPSNNDFDNISICSNQLVDLHNSKDSFFKFSTNKDGAAFFLFITELTSKTDYSCVEIAIDEEASILTTSDNQILVPLVSDLEIKKSTSTSYKQIPATSSVPLPANTEILLKSSTSVLSHALLFSKIL